MKKHESKTGYFKNTDTGECSASPIYCPDDADFSIYREIAKSTYDKYIKAKLAEMQKRLEDNTIVAEASTGESA